MINYSETHYNWFRISVLGGILLSLLIFSLTIWGFNPFAKKQDLDDRAGGITRISPIPLLSPTPTVFLTPTPTSPPSNRDIFTAPKDSKTKRDLTLPTPTPIITLPYSSICPTETALFDKKGQPQGCLVRPKF